MKKFVAWDTSSKVGVIVAGQLVAQDSVEAAFGKASPSYRRVAELTLSVDTATHSERLLWGIDQVLQAAGWELGDLDFLGVGLGPGSFTGLRIGITTARTLASTQQVPLVGVSSLALLARPVARWAKTLPEKVFVMAVTDACKGELFALWGEAEKVFDADAFFTAQEKSLDGPSLVLKEGRSDLPTLQASLGARRAVGVCECVEVPGELVAELSKAIHLGSSEEGSGVPPESKGKRASGLSSVSAFVLVGEGKDRYLDIWSRLPLERRLSVPVIFSDQVEAKELGQLVAESYWKSGGNLPQPLEVKPRYYRDSDAQVKLRKGLLLKNGPLEKTKWEELKLRFGIVEQTPLPSLSPAQEES